MLDEALFMLLADSRVRERFRAVLIESYFSPEIQQRVVRTGILNRAAYRYAQQLLSESRESTEDYLLRFEEDAKPIRDQGFRRAIVQLYEHRCALCGIRIRTPEGWTVVEAAHIHPWSKSYDDRPGNGLCLCRLCHWSFDYGLMGVGDDYEVLVSNRVRTEHNMPGQILTLTDRPIFKPERQEFWPARENLAWHRRHVYG